MKQALTTLCLVLFLAACSVTSDPAGSTAPVTDSSSGIRLTVERTTSGTMRLQLRNDSASPVGYNLCSSALERRSGSEWRHVETGEVCTMQIMTLVPGATATFEKRLPSGLAAGDYRYVTGIDTGSGGGQLRVATEPFQVP